jgi:hypothetical protein
MMEEEPWDGDFSGTAEEQHTSELGILRNLSEISNTRPRTSNSHLPQLVWYYKLANPTSAVQKSRVVLNLIRLAPTSRSSHVLYILVFHNLRPITQLGSGSDMRRSFQRMASMHFMYMFS